MTTRHTRTRRLLVTALTALAVIVGGTASADVPPQEGFSRYFYKDLPQVPVGLQTPRVVLLTECEDDKGTNCKEHAVPSQTIGDGSSLWYRLSVFAQKDPGTYLDADAGCALGETGARLMFSGTSTDTDVIFLIEDLNIVDDPATIDIDENDVLKVPVTLTKKTAENQGVSLCISG